MIGLDAIAAGADLASLSHDEKVSALLRLAAAQTRLAATMADRPENRPPAPELLDAPAMAARLKVNESWIRSEARLGRLPCVHLGRYRRFDPIAVAAALEARPTIAGRPKKS